MTLQAIRMRTELLAALRVLLAETGDRRACQALRATIETVGVEVAS